MRCEDFGVNLRWLQTSHFAFGRDSDVRSLCAEMTAWAADRNFRSDSCLTMRSSPDRSIFASVSRHAMMLRANARCRRQGSFSATRINSGISELVCPELKSTRTGSTASNSRLGQGALSDADPATETRDDKLKLELQRMQMPGQRRLRRLVPAYTSPPPPPVLRANPDFWLIAFLSVDSNEWLRGDSRTPQFPTVFPSY